MIFFKFRGIHHVSNLPSSLALMITTSTPLMAHREKISFAPSSLEFTLSFFIETKDAKTAP
jgi:hypothetical protein